MTANRLWIIVLALASVAIVALGWVLGVQPQLDSALAAQQQRKAVEVENMQHAADLADLKEQYDDIESLRRELAGLRDAVPVAVDQAGVIGTVNAVAAELGVPVVGISWGDSRLYAPADPGTPAPVPTEEPAEGDAAATPAPADPAAPAMSTADPSAGIVVTDAADVQALTGTLVAVPVTITITADYTQLLRFISRLDSSTRLFLVTGSSLAPPADNGPGASTIDGLVYVLPGGPGTGAAGGGDTGEPQTAGSRD